MPKPNPILEYMENLRQQEKREEKKTKESTALPSPGFPNGRQEPNWLDYKIPRSWWESGF